MRPNKHDLRQYKRLGLDDPEPRPRSRSPTGQAASAGDSFRTVVQRFWVDGTLDATKSCKLVRAGSRSGAVGVADLARAGDAGRLPKNIARDMVRQLLKGASCPPLRWKPITVWSSKHHCSVKEDLPFLCIDEVLQHCCDKRPDLLEATQLDECRMPELSANVAWRQS